MHSSRIPGFYAYSLDRRREMIGARVGLSEAQFSSLLRGGGLDPQQADKTVENVVETFALPFAVGLNVQINGIDYLAPMVVEEPSVVAAASNAARIVRSGGGFVAAADEPHMIAQVQLLDVANF